MRGYTHQPLQHLAKLDLLDHEWPCWNLQSVQRVDRQVVDRLEEEKHADGDLRERALDAVTWNVTLAYEVTIDIDACSSITRMWLLILLLLLLPSLPC